MPDTPASPEKPILHDEDGELSLHFDFPTVQSRMLKTDPERLVLDYTRSMMGFLLFRPRPARIAMIGLGGGSIAKYCRARLPDTDFTAVEISAEVIALRDAFGIPPDGPCFRIVCADGADFVRDASDAFDVLLVDGFDAGGQPARLCSPEFYADCRERLVDGGVLVVNLCADDTGYGSYVGRIAAAFDDRVAVIETEEGFNKIVFALKGEDLPSGIAGVSERLRGLEAAHPIGLDETAQKILMRGRGRRVGRRGRR